MSRREFFAADSPPGLEVGVTVEPEITEAELNERLVRLKALGQTIGRDFAMKVVVGKKPGWCYKFRPINTIEVDPTDVRKKGLEYCFGLIAHEGAHRRVSRVDFIPKSIWQQAGFSFLMNAVEDPRVNNWVSAKYDGAAAWLKQVYDEDIPIQKITEASDRSLGYVPKHIRFGLEVIRFWHTGNFSDDLPEDVRVVLEKTITEAKVAYETVPKSEPEEEEIIIQAKVAYEIVKEKIWPEYKKLIKQAEENEALRQLIKQMAENGDLELPEEATAESSKEPTSPENWPDELREKIEEELRKKFEEMSEDEVTKIIAAAEAVAKKNLEDLETDVVVELRGKFSDQPETAGEEKNRRCLEAEASEIEKQRQAEANKIKAELEKQRQAASNNYDTAFEEIKPFIDTLSNQILEILVAKRWPRFRRAFPGQKLRLSGAMEFQADRHNYKKLFERRLTAERPDVEILLLVDLSGSMRGGKIKETFKGVVLFLEALKRAAEISGAIKVQTFGFQNTLIPFQTRDQSLDDSLRKEIATMPGMVNDPNADYNNDGYCLDGAAGILRQSQAKDKIIIVLSDGQPRGDKEHRVAGFESCNEKEELVGVIRQISDSGDLRLLGIGLGSGTDHVKSFYDNSLPNVENIPNVDIRGLLEVLSEKIVKLIS